MLFWNVPDNTTDETDTTDDETSFEGIDEDSTQGNEERALHTQKFDTETTKIIKTI